MEFTYQARHPQGQIASGTLLADSLEQATQKLRREGLHIVSLQAVADNGADSLGSLVLFQPRISRQEIIYFANQLAVLTDTGVTLSAALQGIEHQTQNASLRKLIGQIRADVEAGEDFSKALAKHPRHFDQVFVQLVRASEASGSMGKMLERIAAYSRKQMETRRKVRAAMMYPLVMLVMAIGVSIFLLAYVFPKFAPLFESRGLALPGPTRFMMALSHALTDHWYLLGGAVAVLVAGLLLLVRTAPGRSALDLLKLHAPIVGPMFRKAAISRSLRTLATMINSGVPMLEAIELSGRVAGNVHYNRFWEQVSSQVVGGRQICDAIGEHPLFPHVLVQMISAGEQTGKLGPVLNRVSDFYDEELETAVKAATSLIEPIMVGVMGVVVGAVAMSLLLPIFTLSRQAG